MQSFDAAGQQVGWTNLRSGGGPFSAEFSPPEGAARSSLVMVMKGMGAITLKGLRVVSR